jgi:hypothetical protein
MRALLHAPRAATPRLCAAATATAALGCAAAAAQRPSTSRCEERRISPEAYAAVSIPGVLGLLGMAHPATPSPQP